MGVQPFLAIPPESHFSIHNLPYGAFRPRPGLAPRLGCPIGEHVLDLSALAKAGLLGGGLLGDGSCFREGSLNAFMALGRPAWQQARARIQALLSSVGESELRDDRELRERALWPLEGVVVELPAAIGDYTDFYSSREHAMNVGALFRGRDAALPPNWLHVPIGYHGRASSVVVSGTGIRRPCGQLAPVEGATAPQFGPTKALDFELEVAIFAGPGNALGEPILIDRALDHVFGLVLMNDWSARDIQRWEYVPLGPFLGKSFGTTISPWVVTLEALEGFRCEAPVQDPAPLPYLTEAERHTFDIHLEAHLRPEGAEAPTQLCTSNFRHLYWTLAQQVAHHTSNGCCLRPGDLLASGTISGPEESSWASLLELTRGGARDVQLAHGGGTRKFLEDGDEVVLTAHCQGDGFRVGFGECAGKVLPSTRQP